MATARRRAALEEYFAAHVLRDEGLVCRHASACRASAIRPGVDFHEGQLSYLGSHYDLLTDEGRGVLDAGEIGAVVDHRARDAFRNPGARARLVPASTAARCKDHVETALEALTRWVRN